MFISRALHESAGEEVEKFLEGGTFLAPVPWFGESQNFCTQSRGGQGESRWGGGAMKKGWEVSISNINMNARLLAK